ncbi:MAG: hypothetical protein J0J04_04710 [Microbacterium sp.]|uniref:hypothetical protein n=1 Tax=Microbacterium sp. TaxID=51671 RepID=UPI001AC266F8|nr:hypothetical protein [Microbacterium sp.]MBN9214109.1 hypothetical protein [Microbacterium sp.]
MTRFDEIDHPRGQAANAGQFRAKENGAPTTTLTALADFGTAPALADIPKPTDDDLRNAEVESYYRQGDREISDAAAITIARDILHNYPATVPGGPESADTVQLRRVAAGTPINPSDFDAVDDLHAELARVYKRGAGSGPYGQRDRRIDSMFTWSLKGGDNSR